MNIERKSVKNVEVISLDGEIDMFVSPQVREALLKAIEQTPRAILFDLSQVSYMDSSGIATLVEGLQWSKKQCGRLILAGVRENVFNTLKLAKLHELFEMSDSVDVAIECLG